jgi:hypothetical protein
MPSLRSRSLLATVVVLLLLGAGTAIAAAPGVLYEEPSGVTTAEAVLQGSINPSDKPTTYYFEYGATTAYGSQTPNGTLPKSKAWQPVSVALSGLEPGSIYHYRLVAWNGGGTKDKTVGADRSFTTAAPPPDPSDPAPGPGDPPAPGNDPPAERVPVPDAVRPELGSSVVIDPGRGHVMVRRPGSHGFVPLTAGAELPLGTEVDARDASLALNSALPSGKTQTGRFGGGRFEVRQDRKGYVDLYLRGPACSAARHATAASAARRARTRRLWGRDHGGRFRTHGRNSHATVRGTRWVVEDRCDGTLTSVSSGAVVVRDTVRHRRVVLHAGERYLARNR